MRLQKLLSFPVSSCSASCWRMRCKLLATAPVPAAAAGLLALMSRSNTLNTESPKENAVLFFISCLGHGILSQQQKRQGRTWTKTLKGMERVCMQQKPSQGLSASHGLGWLGIRYAEKNKCLGGAYGRGPLQTQVRCRGTFRKNYS